MKQLYSSIAILLFFTVYVNAQNLSDLIQFDPVLLEERGDSLLLEMDIHLKAEAITKNQSWTILPALVTPDSSYCIQMPVALVNGKRKAQLFKRKERFKNTKLLAEYPAIRIDRKNHRDTTFRYAFRAPYELWMDRATLQISHLITSCADTRKRFTQNNVARVQLLPYAPYQPTVTVNYLTPEKEVKTLYREGSAYLDFQVGSSVILPGFRRNPQELEKINQLLSQVMNEKDFELSGVAVTGYASPEGSWKSNDRLSLARAEALRQYITGKYPVVSQLMKVSNVPEDWEGLVEMIRQGDMDSKAQVIEIIETVNDPDTRERSLRALGGGRPFRYMLNEYFPSLRRVVYRVEFTVKEYSLEESEVIMQKNPEQLNHYELTLLYRNYTGNPQEQENIMNLITERFPDSSLAASNAIAYFIEKGEIEKAEKFIDKAKELPQAYNNVGVCYLMMEELQLAEEYLRQARTVLTGNDLPYTREEVELHLEEVAKKKKDLEKRKRYN